MSYSVKRHHRLTDQAKESFASHQITKRSEGRWLLQQHYDDGVPSNNMRTEIISLDGGALYVGGDIDFVIYAWYSNSAEHEGKVRWMGRCTDVRYYVRQKAVIGTGSQLIDVYDEEQAKETVQEWLADERESLVHEAEYAELDGTHDYIAKLEEVLADEFAPWEDRYELVDYLLRQLGANFMIERSYELGEVVAPRVYFTHAALGRLCDLLDAERAAERPLETG